MKLVIFMIVVFKIKLRKVVLFSINNKGGKIF